MLGDGGKRGRVGDTRTALAGLVLLRLRKGVLTHGAVNGGGGAEERSPEGEEVELAGE